MDSSLVYLPIHEGSPTMNSRGLVFLEMKITTFKSVRVCIQVHMY
jgi:hypothetical protein